MLTSAASVGGDGSEGRSEIRLMAALKKESACEYMIILYYIAYYIWYYTIYGNIYIL
jgi:hypothetical protein